MNVTLFLTNVFSAVSKILSNQRVIDLLFVFFALAFIATVPCLVRYFICSK